MIRKYFIKMMLTGTSVFLLLSSCTVLNKYHSPQFDTSNLYRDVYVNDTSSTLQFSWKDFFEDRYLQSLIEEGIINNHDMLIALQKIRQAEVANEMARTAYFPTIAIAGQAELQSNNGNTEKNFMSNHNETYTLGIVSSWEFDIWGKIKSESRVKEAEMWNSYAGYKLIQTALIANIANNYYSLLALDEELTITKEMIETMSYSLNIIEYMKDAGFMTAAAVEQTKATLYQMKVTVPDLENKISKMENNLCHLIGRKPGSIERKTINEQQIIHPFQDGIPLHTINNRPDIQQAELEFRIAFEWTNVAKTEFYPTLTLNSGVFGYSSTNTINHFFHPENLFINIVGGITQPVFNKKRIRKQYEISQLKQKEALINFEKSILSACIEISDIIKTYETAMNKIQLRNVQVESLDRSVLYTQELLIAGEATYLEVLSAQQGLLDARLSQVSDKLQQLQTYSDLYRALGGGTN